MRVHEEKREEEIAPEQSQANAVAYRADDHLPLAPFLFGVIVIAALAGVVAADPPPPLARATR